MKTARLPGSVTSSKSHNLAYSQAANDQSTAFPFHKFYPNVSDFCIPSVIYATSCTPTIKDIIILNVD